ncbi:MAG: LysM peptidoglycan-binding domain-containing M23 family metallopeptidase [Leptospiraceae bacterium]|nr:peptidoglycan DD-metalloendopeptidase family protein [Leptospiraceae bacterium]MCK6380052.1 LysM peptidoglycan-binding domain-containing M23 family metallopeptidase [Leptospiraceae bacterium]NUM40645.1 peptidoglycan DD-metalloendopeptidase family protein [Leptospiraceae bacterium]
MFFSINPIERIVKILFLILIHFSALYSFSVIPLGNLEYSNKLLQKLREDVRYNLKASKSSPSDSNLTELKFYKYKVEHKDNFFIIMARTGMDLDTLSSVNSLSNPKDLYTGMTLLIPNMRGVYDRSGLDESLKSRKTLSEKYSIPKNILIFDKDRNEWFIPGRGLEKTEKSFFYGLAFMKPLDDGVQSSPYGFRKDPFTNKKTFHGGIDIAAEKGTDVYASADGEIIISNKQNGYGNLVIIKHALGFETRYGHLSKFFVKKGQKVKRGDKIGEVGNTGRATGNHLHFEVRRFSKNQKPNFRIHNSS